MIELITTALITITYNYNNELDLRKLYMSKDSKGSGPLLGGEAVPGLRSC